MKDFFMGIVRVLLTILCPHSHPDAQPQNVIPAHGITNPIRVEGPLAVHSTSPLIAYPAFAPTPCPALQGNREGTRKLSRSMSALLPRSAGEIRRLIRLGRERRQKRAARAPRTERTIAAVLRGFDTTQTVIIGEVPRALPSGRVFAISPGQDAPPGCIHVRCETQPDEWPVAAMVMGFNRKAASVWLLRMLGVADPVLVQQLRAVAMMCTPGSVVLLLTWAPIAAQVADSAGFSLDAVQHKQPLLLLRRKEEPARSEDTGSFRSSPSYNPLPEPASGEVLMTFELEVESLPQAARNLLERGSVRVVGNSQDLGRWNVEYGVPLQLSGATMVAELILDGGCSEVEYKYVFVDEQGDTVWEVGENRRLPQADGNLMCVEDQWRSCWS